MGGAVGQGARCTHLVAVLLRLGRIRLQAKSKYACISIVPT
jgi:hypothetical protein